MKKIIYSLTLAGILLFIAASMPSGCSKSDNHSGNSLNSNDKQFLVSASYSNVDEVDAGTLASTKAGNAGVKGFGQMMMTDHWIAEDELKNLADSLQVPVPQQPDSVHQAIKQTLIGLSGMTFDTTYLHGQINDHQNTIALMQNEINSGQNTAVTNYARKYLPKIQMHLMMADSLMMVVVNTH
jgi:putative membrane protein